MTKIRTEPAGTALLVFLLEESNAEKTRHTVQAPPGLRHGLCFPYGYPKYCEEHAPLHSRGRKDNTRERVWHALAERVPGHSFVQIHCAFGANRKEDTSKRRLSTTSCRTGVILSFSGIGVTGRVYVKNVMIIRR